MAADFNKPAVADNYSTGYTPAIVDNLVALAKALDPAVVTPANIPTNAVGWSSANSRWEKYNGTSWAVLCASYAINISGTAANVTGTVAVGNGGTGATSFTSGGLVVGNGTSALGIAAVGGWTLGDEVGVNTLVASVVAGQGLAVNPVTFTATGTAFILHEH